MNLSMLDRFRPYVSRILGAGIGALAGVLSTKFSIPVDPSTQAAITSAVTAGIYGIAHKVIDKTVNPGDAASTHLAVQEKSEADSLKGN